MGGRQVGRSEPAFRVASTTALPPPTCTARREAGQLHRRLLFCCEACMAGSSAVVFCKACAGRIVRRLCSPAAALFSRLCLPVRLCHAMTIAHIISLPPFILLCPPCSFPCAPGSSQATRTVLLAATTWACSGGPCTVLRHYVPVKKGEVLDCV